MNSKTRALAAYRRRDLEEFCQALAQMGLRDYARYIQLCWDPEAVMRPADIMRERSLRVGEDLLRAIDANKTRNPQTGGDYFELRNKLLALMR